MRKVLLLVLILASVSAVAQTGTGLYAVAKTTLIGSNTGPIPLTTIYTPAADGDFLITVYAESLIGSSLTDYYLGWTDDHAPQTVEGPLAYLSGGTASSAWTIPIHDTAGNPITFGPTTSTCYDCYYYVVVVKL